MPDDLTITPPNAQSAYARVLAMASYDAVLINASSDVLRLLPRPRVGALPDTYLGMFRDIEHLVRLPNDTVVVSSDPVPFLVHFPTDYAASADKNLLYRVVSPQPGALVHPNLSGATLCLGTTFRPGTRLRALMYELYRIVSSQDFASDAPLDPWAARYFVDHIEQVRSLRARPLWRKRLALRAVVTEHSGATGRSTGAAK